MTLREEVTYLTENEKAYDKNTIYKVLGIIKDYERMNYGNEKIETLLTSIRARISGLL